MLRYYDVKKNWRKVKPFIQSAEAARIIRENFFRFDNRGLGFEMFVDGPTLPADHDYSLWLFHKPHRPRFWDYVCVGGCYWLVHLNLFLAKKVEPLRAWRIVSSNQHATVWDGDELLFDMNFLALGIPPEGCLEMAQNDKTEDEMVAEEISRYSPGHPGKIDPLAIRKRVQENLAVYNRHKLEDEESVRLLH